MIMDYLLANTDKFVAIFALIITSIITRYTVSLNYQTWVNTFSGSLTLLLLPIITYSITSVISGNIALSLGMIGALSIVRFRNPVRSSFELVIFFFMISLGICAAVDLRWLIILGFSCNFVLLITFYSYNSNNSHIYNILATLASINLYTDIRKLKKDVFLKFKIPIGRGDISKIKFKNKKIFLVDETYNSNPLSLKTAIENYNKIELKNSKKYLILGDMLELGNHSIKQHKLISKIINKTKINKVFVIGKHIRETFKGLVANKKAKIINNKLDIINLINDNLDNNDYLMIKGSNSTGLHKIITKLKQRSKNAI